MHARLPPEHALAGPRWRSGLGTFVAHTFLMKIPYDASVVWQRILMQTFVDAGDWNKYPVLPWFGLGVMGSAMAVGWFGGWKTVKQRS